VRDKVPSAVAGIAARCFRLFQLWRQCRRDHQVLIRLDERALRDLGLERADIEDYVRDDLWK